MNLVFIERGTNGVFSLRKEDRSFKGEGIRKTGTINTIVFNRHEEQQVTIDQVPYNFPANTVLPLVSDQHFVFERPEELIAWQFNKEFYCIVDHDAEVGCVGYLFYGIRHPLFLPLSPEEVNHIVDIERMSLEDLQIEDSMQGEMLRTHLKRLIIITTRIAKKQLEGVRRLTEDKANVIRTFNLLLETNFKKEHEVQFYANALNRSPKTLTNLFAILNYPAPSKLIQRRIILEAKRYLFYTDRSAKEIAYTLGFANPAHFSRFFKQYSGTSISDFRDKRVNDIIS